jgi:hypothetical protein
MDLFKKITRLLSRLSLVACLWVGENGWADKLDVAAGFYDLTATVTDGKSASISGPGVFEVAYRHAILSHYEFALGYTLLMSKLAGGDQAYGIDVAVNYYPMSLNENFHWNQDKTKIEVIENWRPFVGLSFNQRQFPGTGGFAGPGLVIGVERPIDEQYSAFGKIRYIMETGSSAKLTEMDLLFGLTLNF